MDLFHHFVRYCMSLMVLATAPLVSASDFLLAAEGQSDKSVVEFLSSISALLPDKVKADINSKVSVRFIKLGDATSLVPPCSFEEGQETASLPKYARHILSSTRGNFVIEVNEQFLDVIKAGPQSAKTYNCGHKNLYRLAQATILHEVAHIFDLRTGLDFLSKEFQAQYNQYVSLCEVENHRNDKMCNYYKTIRGRISDSGDYLDVIGWNYRDGHIENKNKKITRSPDPLEYTNQYEHFAVNFEYFILDPEFSCRRPTLNSHLKKILNHKPFSNPSCQVNTSLMYNFTPQLIDLNPERIYQVHYLLASKGSESDSSCFGHSMYRVVGCAPTTQVGPACLDDIDYHYVVSYRLNVIDMVQNNLGAIFGGYPSQIFMYPFFEILSEYTMKEGRSLLSYPLHLDRPQIRQFIHKVIEMYWQYSGDYFFLSNNCATESRDLLRSVFPDVDLETGSIVTPYGLQEVLNTKGKVDSSVMALKNASGRYFFPSFKEKLSELFQSLNSGLGGAVKLSLEQFKTMNAKQRFEFHQNLTARYSRDTKRITAIWIGMEFIFKEIELAKIRQKQIEIFSAANSGKYPDVKALIDQNRTLKIGIQPWKITLTGYGIPFKEDRINAQEMSSRIQQVDRISNEINRIVEQLFPSEYEEVRNILDNKKKYMEIYKGESN